MPPRRLPIALAALSIFFLSFLLFLSGWMLQQQSIQALNEALLLTDPTTTSSTDQYGNTVLGNLLRQGSDYVASAAKGSGARANSKLNQACTGTDISFAEERQTAFAVLANTRQDVCHGLILFRRLREQFGVRSDLVLVVPSEWVDEMQSTEAGNGTFSKAQLETRRLARLAQRDLVRLEIGEKMLPNHFRHETPLSPLNVMHLTKYKRVMLLNPTSILRTSPRAFLGSMSKLTFGIAYPALPNEPEQPNPHLLVVTPSTSVLKTLTRRAPSDQTPLQALGQVLQHSTLKLPAYPNFLPTSSFTNPKVLESYVPNHEELGAMRLMQTTMLLSFLNDDGTESRPWFVPKSGNTGDGMLQTLRGEFADSRRDVCGWDWEFER